MSKYVKNLIAGHLHDRLKNVHDALLVNMIGLNANTNHRLRAELRSKNISVVVVKNSLAARATAGTPLGPLFNGVSGTAAICWGAEDIVSLAKEITRLLGNEQYKAFEARGGVMDGEQLSAAQVKEVSQWPSRREQLSILVGQILSPGANLASQLESAGGALASQIEQIVKEKEGKEGETTPAEAAPAEAAPAEAVSPGTASAEAASNEAAPQS
jgi:large subunit ribosomal protein L10